LSFQCEYIYSKEKNNGKESRQKRKTRQEETCKNFKREKTGEKREKSQQIKAKRLNIAPSHANGLIAKTTIKD
jgi:hypothetical protein